MSTYHLPTAVPPLVDWTASYAVRRRLWPVAATGASDLTPRDAAHGIRAIDAVCAERAVGRPGRPVTGLTRSG
jgi:hypothetical protein